MNQHWSGKPFPTPKDLPYPGMEPGSPGLQADSLLSKSPGKPQRPTHNIVNQLYFNKKNFLMQGLKEIFPGTLFSLYPYIPRG